jgi:hypothetical protein
MALARIITRSEACARELSQDLLARGYVVEVFSPDHVPDHTADLELRVETGDGDKLTAKVKVQHGERSASLDFVHQLKAPVAEVHRANRAAHFSLAVANANRDMARDKEDPKLAAKAPLLAAKADGIAAEVPLKPALDTEFDSEEIARPDSSALVPLVSRRPRTGAVAASSRSTARPAFGRRDRSEGWFWRASLGFAGLVLLGLVAGFGMSQGAAVLNSQESGEISGTVPTQVSASPADAAWFKLAGSVENTVPNSNSEISPGKRPEAKADHGRNELARQNSEPSRPGTASEATGKSVHDLVARDTVTYLDEHYKPAPKTLPPSQLARQQRTPGRHSGVIAANSVTYLNDKPNPKPK